MDEEDEADVQEESSEEEEEGGEEADDGLDDSDEEDDTAAAMAACGEAPTIPPDGFAYAPCPPLVTLDDKRALVGRKVLTARIDDDATGWYIGTVVSDTLSASWKKGVPTATHLVEYKKAETGTRALNDKVASELSPANYGGAEWWILLDRVEGSVV